MVFIILDQDHLVTMINSLLFKESALLSRSFFIYLHSFSNSFSAFYFSLFSVLIIQEMNQQYSSQCCLLLINRAWAFITISLYLINCWDLSFISNSILNYYQLKELGKVCWIFALSRRLKFCILEVNEGFLYGDKSGTELIILLLCLKKLAWSCGRSKRET